MSWSYCSFIKRMAEFRPKREVSLIPHNTRGLYALLNQVGSHYSVVYVGMSAGDGAGMRSRLKRHNLSKRKQAAWTHFTICEVHDNVPRQEIRELEGLLRHLYRKDLTANGLNTQLTYRPFKKVTRNDLRNWM